MKRYLVFGLMILALAFSSVFAATQYPSSKMVISKSLPKNTAGKLYVYAHTDTDGSPSKTGDAAQITCTAYSLDGAAHAHLTDTSATEIDSTNLPGWYAFDMTAAEANATEGLYRFSSSTANVVVSDLDITFHTVVTAASGVVEADLVNIHGSALTETAGQIAAAFVKFFDKATPTGTINSLPDAVAGATGGLFIAGTNTGNVVISPTAGVPLTLTAGTGNSSGFLITGSGSGDGIKSTGGATGDGLDVRGGSSVGVGFIAIGSGASEGIFAQGGSGGAHGVQFESGGGTGDDFYLANSDAPTLAAAQWNALWTSYTTENSFGWLIKRAYDKVMGLRK